MKTKKCLCMVVNKEMSLVVNKEMSLVVNKEMSLDRLQCKSIHFKLDACVHGNCM